MSEAEQLKLIMDGLLGLGEQGAVAFYVYLGVGLLKYMFLTTVLTTVAYLIYLGFKYAVDTSKEVDTNTRKLREVCEYYETGSYNETATIIKYINKYKGDSI
jgi:hypothetical protein